MGGCRYLQISLILIIAAQNVTNFPVLLTLMNQYNGYFNRTCLLATLTPLPMQDPPINNTITCEITSWNGRC